MAAQYELLKELLNSGTKLSFGQEFFFKFYQAFILKDRWTQYIKGVSTTLLVTAIALALGIVLGSVVALVRVAHTSSAPAAETRCWASSTSSAKFTPPSSAARL